jgi:pyruvate kinase
MLRSMMFSPTPTRAEVSDISNSVLEGCDSILLSDEIAVGEFPVEAVRVADITIRESEKIFPYYKDMIAGDRTQAIASSSAQLTRALKSKPIVVTSTGRAAVEVSRYRPESDIIVFSHDAAVLRKLALAWGICPAGVIATEPDVAKMVSILIKESLDTGLVTEADTVTIVHGFMSGVSGTTNTIQVLNVREYLTLANSPA